MTKQTFTSKTNGDTLSATEWNNLTSYVNEAVDAINSGSGSTSAGSTADTSGVVSISAKGNTEISSAKNINLEPLYDTTGSDTGSYGDIQLKPGDDITLESGHRASSKQDEITVKVVDGNKTPVKLQVMASEMTLSTKNKTGNDSNVMDVNVTTGSGKGYLKVRALAIDLRCEDHGGIAIQPKGSDSSNNMNKIKFEHGGGDGLEFGTFNTEKTSIFTDEYRFNKNGIWKMATRTTEVSDKYDETDETTHYKYVKAADDFYDNIDAEDETATTNAIIKTAHALNDGKNRHAKYEEKIDATTGEVTKKTVEIETVKTIGFKEYTYPEGYSYRDTNLPAVTFNSFTGTQNVVAKKPVNYETFDYIWELPSEISDVNKIYTISEFKDAIAGMTTNEGVSLGFSYVENVPSDSTNVYSNRVYNGAVIVYNGSCYEVVEYDSPNINITSNGELKINAKNTPLELKGEGIEFGSDVIDLGEMEDGLYAQYKLTKKNNSKPCDTLKIKVINNNTSASMAFDADSENFAVDSFYPGMDNNHPAVTVPAKLENPTTDAEATQHIVTVAQCKLYDVVKFVAWAKANNFGPWASN